MESIERFEGFEYSLSEIQKFIAACDIFSILLKNGQIIHYKPHDKDAFASWLEDNNVINLKKEED